MNWSDSRRSGISRSVSWKLDAVTAPATLFDRIWDDHVITELGDGFALLHVDRHLVHDLGGPGAFAELARRGLPVSSPELTFAVPDHVVSSAPGRTGGAEPWAQALVDRLRDGSATHRIRFFDIDDPGQGIVHVIGPEQGLTLPGLLLVCGDSHTSTHGALGALAWGIGATEIVHVLATQSIVQKRPRRLRVRVDGRLHAGADAKDLILHLIRRFGAAAGSGHAVEYAGSAIEALSMEERMTVCNMSIEWGARIGMVAPDDTTFAWLEARPFAPRGALWERALDDWRSLRSHPSATFDRELVLDGAAVRPMITWGTSPEHAIELDGVVPDPQAEPDASRAEALRKALDYMDLVPGRPIAGTRIDRVFIGSCTNGRLSDLRKAASALRGRRVAPHVEAWVVPGSAEVAAQARAEGLDRLFTAAGFQWRAPGCSLCVGANGELVASGARCVSTSNRNFVGRQGPGARTHLAGPATAAACAVAGEVVDGIA
jgi:3-isopropylmalate/(R)-2-methylmalate dehydratase large subunit